LRKKHTIPIYIKKLIEKYPYIKSGRKNFLSYEIRINKTIELIKEYKKIKPYKNND